MIKKTILSLLLLLFIYLIVQYKASPQNIKPTSKADVIIVLGISNNNKNKPNIFLKQRLDKAIKIYNQGFAERMLLTGAKVRDETSEAEIMLAYCLENGIPREAILLEPNAQNTEENAAKSHEIMESNNLQSAIIVTTPAHIPRSKILFSKYITELQMIPANNTFLTFVLSKPMVAFEKKLIEQLEK